ncbi:MAG: helix-turn-helix domain-containing protein [Holophagales bacterium]|jgi:transcriptional regulator with XRE-family HTH domain|nr:helix-turn-helix domain-containing protein [Holophagales bacterium]
MHDTWPQRENFKRALEKYQAKTGKKQAEVAEDLNMSLHGLRQILYQKGRRCSFETAQRASALFGVSVTEFMDDPGAPPYGMDQEKWAAIRERDRVIASAMFSDITADQLTEAEKDELYRAYKEAKERIIRLRDLR